MPFLLQLACVVDKGCIMAINYVTAMFRYAQYSTGSMVQCGTGQETPTQVVFL